MHILSSGVIPIGISDHNLVYVVRSFKLPKSKPIIKEIRDFKHFSESDFRNDLLQVPWNTFLWYNDPNLCWIIWKSTFYEVLNRHAPIRHRRLKSNTIPWITPIIKQLIRARDYHKKKAIKCNSTIHWSKYQALRNRVNIQLRKSKANFFHREFEDCARVKNIKKSWSLINSLTGNNNKSSSVTEISVDDCCIVDSTLIAECFNEYFVNIGPKLASEVSDESLDQEAYSHDNSGIPIDTRFSFQYINVDNVTSSLMNLKTNKSTGLDKIPAKILKLSADIISPSLTYLFNLSLETGIYIDDWKRARVIPIYKSDDRRKCENYRPISILPIISKVFEGEVFRQLYCYLTDNSLLSKFQSGFRPKHSTLSALIQMCDDLLKNMDNGNLNCVVFLDVRKAFDSINHKILLNKMRDLFGISGIQLNWFESYLSNREQQCLINGSLSTPKKIRCGVPQGSILGPLFFLLYINDMPDCLQNSVPSLYADDTVIYASSTDCDDLVARINADLENIRKWMIRNKLQIHPKKCKYMFIGSSHNLNNKITDHHILINNTAVARTYNYSCLGVNMDERLSWGNHIDHICSKASAGIGMIRRIKPFVPLPTLKMLYNAIVQPYFDYCSPLWDNCGCTHKDRLQKYQNRAARVITGKSYDVRSVDLLADLQWTPLETRRKNLKLLFTYKIINGHTAPNLRNKIRFNYEMNYPYNLRNSDTDLALPKPKKDFGKRCFNYNAAVIWNELPHEAKTAPNLCSFKRLIKHE